MKTIQSKTLGQLTQYEEFEDWWESQAIEIPYFENEQIVITYSDFTPEEDPNFLAEADAAVGEFLKKGISERTATSKLVYKNCMDFLHAIGFEEEDQALWDIKDANEIWKFVYPSEIYVSRRRYKEQDIYVQICCECDWEQEHGLQIVLRQGKQVTRVSSQDGHLTEADAYGKPDEQDELLSQFIG
ncbi:MAG: hypothetical protein AAF705_09150 [Bacteroidota bacterium]